jgi:DNA polymerase III delta prime subunit
MFWWDVIADRDPALFLRRYATSLRQLRPFARIIRFKKAQPAIMVKRLRDICERESLSADARSLTTLVEITNADVRSCLNTLQVRKRRQRATRKPAESIHTGAVYQSQVWGSEREDDPLIRRRFKGRRFQRKRSVGQVAGPDVCQEEEASSRGCRWQVCA